MEFEEVIASRYSVRKYSDRPVEDEKLQKILETGRLAPTAKNLQGQVVYVVKSKDAMEKLKAHCIMTFDAPVVLMIGMRKDQEWVSHFSQLNRGQTDAAIITDEMMLQAHALGLGTCWVGWFDPAELQEVFGIPDDIVLYNLLPIGYPADDAVPGPMHPQRKPLEETVKYL